jgi:hypothetical protein
MDYLKRYTHDPNWTIQEKCKQLRNKIALNLYYLNKAPEKLKGNKLTYVIKILKDENKQLYKMIKLYKCQGHDEILLTTHHL